MVSTANHAISRSRSSRCMARGNRLIPISWWHIVWQISKKFYVGWFLCLSPYKCRIFFFCRVHWYVIWVTCRKCEHSWKMLMCLLLCLAVWLMISGEPPDERWLTMVPRCVMQLQCLSNSSVKIYVLLLGYILRLKCSILTQCIHSMIGLC